MDNSTETSITLKDCINSLLETEKERNDIKIFLVDNFLTDSWSKQIINLSVGKEKEVSQIDFFDNFAESIFVKSYDSTTSALLFLEYFKKYSNLKDDLISEIKSEENAPWISEIFEKKKLFFLVSDSQWKYHSSEVRAKIDMVLIGMDKLPTLEINL
ncbi:unknown [Clostridium sp. CAG:470]|jgi:hypothetical protein|nr:MAG: hypothetical protein BHW03_03945 [Clostridium sp. 28_17]CDE15233.1 unknown [Clostridium sp. CAG:470]